MKNALFWVLAAVGVVIVGLIGYGIFLSLTNASSGFDVATTVCTGFILVGSLVAWELLMKPGFYGRRRAKPPSEDRVEGPDEGAPGARSR